MFYSLKKITMKNNLTFSSNLENTSSKTSKLKTFISSVALASSLIVSPTNASDISNNSTTIVVDGDIDNKEKLAQISQKIKVLESKIENAQKNIDSLSDKEFEVLISIQKELQNLNEERDILKDVIKNNEESQIDKKLAIIDSNINQKKENLNKNNSKETKLDQDLKQQEAVIKSKLTEIKQALNNK